MLVLNQDQVKKLVPLNKIGIVVDCVEKAFKDYGLGKVQMPPKAYLYFAENNGDLRIMPSFSNTLKMAGTKIVNVHPENPKKGLLTVMASIILNDPKTGLPLAFMDGSYITGMRTGAAGAVAVKYLARKNARTLGVVGAGQQAIYQIAAISKVRQLKEVAVFDINDKVVKELEKAMRKEKIKIKQAELKDVCGKDIVVTTTPVRKPIVKREWILPGTHINAIGADAEGKEELDPAILKQGKIIIDDWAQASHSGEINVPLAKGQIKKSDVYGMLGNIVARKQKGRTNDKEITIFDSTGLGIQDLYTATEVLKIAERKKIGKEIKII
ncbi:MAG: alanine dehydrogenase [Candidatus Pacebacteria bacterium]|nr:alanine dehydrogenase [Candidatus Paceibacterota bacterium]